jgi:hypothetical protein
MQFQQQQQQLMLQQPMQQQHFVQQPMSQDAPMVPQPQHLQVKNSGVDAKMEQESELADEDAGEDDDETSEPIQEELSTSSASPQSQQMHCADFSAANEDVLSEAFQSVSHCATDAATRSIQEEEPLAAVDKTLTIVRSSTTTAAKQLQPRTSESTTVITTTEPAASTSSVPQHPVPPPPPYPMITKVTVPFGWKRIVLSDSVIYYR